MAKKKKVKSKNAGPPAAPDNPVATLTADLKKIEAEIARYKTEVEKPHKAVPVTVHAPVPAASKVEKYVEELVKEDVAEERKEEIAFGETTPARSRKEWGILAFYFVTSIACMGIISFLFGSLLTFIFYSGFGIFVWWWSHQFHKAKSPLMHSYFSLGGMVIFLYIVYLLIHDLMSAMICIMYAISFVISGLLFFYHFKRQIAGEIHESFSRTFLVMFYTHVIAFTAAVSIASILSALVIGDSFVSVIYLLLTMVFPSLLIYFFLTKFLYLRFFDWKHVKMDLVKGLGHGAIYSVLFIVIIILAYLLSAIQLVMMERQSYEESYNEIFTTLQNIKADIDEIPFTYDNPELLSLRVTQEITVISDQLFRDTSNMKAEISRSSFSFNDYLSDNYFTVLAQDRQRISESLIRAAEIEEVKSDLFREYDRLKKMEAEGTYEDGTDQMRDHYAELARFVGENYHPYQEPADLASLRARLPQADSYSVLLADSQMLDIARAFDSDLDVFAAGDSRFSRQMFDAMYHTVIFRDIMLFSFNNAAFSVRETVDPTAVNELFVPADETVGSKTLRYRILKSNLDATIAIAQE